MEINVQLQAPAPLHLGKEPRKLQYASGKGGGDEKR